MQEKQEDENFSFHCIMNDNQFLIMANHYMPIIICIFLLMNEVKGQLPLNSSIDVQLNEGKAQEYSIVVLEEDQADTFLFFIVKPNKSEEISIFVNELSGHIQMFVLESKGTVVSCLDSAQNRFICTFKPQINDTYRVKITGKRGEQNIFTISYKTSINQCYAGKLNQPIYVTLPPSSSQCFTFQTNPQTQLVFSLALSHLQQLQNNIQTTLFINQDPIQTKKSLHRAITPVDMAAFCPIFNSSSSNSCKINVSFRNTQPLTNSFSFVMEEDGMDMILFDGINERVRQQEVWSGEGRYFYYPVSTSKYIQIFFSTKSLRSYYYLAAQFVQKSLFLSRIQLDDVYLPFAQQSNRTFNHSNNYYSISLASVHFGRIGIDSDQIKQNCPDLDCYLAISIYPYMFKESIADEYDEYDIEVSQQETSLSLGEAKIGMLNKNEYFSYLIDPQDAVVEFHALNRQGKNAFCLSASAALSNGTVIKTNQFRSDLQLTKMDQVERIFLKGEIDECSYQIKYVSNTHPFQIVQLSHPYEVSLSEGQVSRFIYYHQNPTSFRVVDQSTSGDAKVYALPIKDANFTLAALLTIPLSKFPVITESWSQLTIDSSSPSFCFSCYYLIAVTTPNKFIGQIIFLRIHDPIPIASNHILKAWLHPNPKSSHTYIYHSLSSFDLTFNMVSGQIAIEIINPKSNTVIRESIKTKTTYRLQSIQYNRKVQLYSSQTRFTIKVSAVTQAIFYIEVNRIHLTYRIFEGYPNKVLIDSTMAPSIEFINSEQLNRTLSFLLTIDDQTEPVIDFTATAQGKKGLVTSDDIIRSITRSERTYALTLNNFEARYFISVKTNLPINATLLLVKSKLTFIAPLQSYLFKGEGVYHISSNSKKILLEVNSCQGEARLFSSSQLSDLANQTNEQSLQSKTGKGLQAFNILASLSYIHIVNRHENADLEYLLRYYDSLINPYDHIDTEDNEIDYQMTQQAIILHLKPPKLPKNDKSLQIVKTFYYGFASQSKISLKRKSRCSIQDSFNFFVSTFYLIYTFANKTKGKWYLTAKAIITVQIQDEAVNQRNITIFYNTIQLDIDVNHLKPFKYWMTNSFFTFLLGIIILSFFVFVVPYYLIVICIRRLMGRQQGLTEEIEQPNNIGTEQEIAGNSNNLPDTGNNMIKEHI